MLNLAREDIIDDEPLFRVRKISRFELRVINHVVSALSSEGVRGHFKAAIQIVRRHPELELDILLRRTLEQELFVLIGARYYGDALRIICKSQQAKRLELREAVVPQHISALMPHLSTEQRMELGCILIKAGNQKLGMAFKAAYERLPEEEARYMARQFSFMSGGQEVAGQKNGEPAWEAHIFRKINWADVDRELNAERETVAVVVPIDAHAKFTRFVKTARVARM